MSARRLSPGIPLMLLSAGCACFGQLLWKLSAQRGLGVMVAGFALYGLGAVLMLVAYRYGRLSVLQPMLAANYALSALLAVFCLGETLTVLRVLGIAVVTLGVVLIGGSDR